MLSGAKRSRNICGEDSAINGWTRARTFPQRAQEYGLGGAKFPEGTRENSPGWSAAQPWDSEQNEPKSRRDVRTQPHLHALRVAQRTMNGCGCFSLVPHPRAKKTLVRIAHNSPTK